MTATQIVLVSLTGYLLGSISFAVLMARSKGVDIFKEGSGNPGATNVKRVLGSRIGNTVFCLDALKGLVAAGWPLILIGGVVGARLAVIGLVAAIIGHSFSVFLKFRGGKGVATAMGGLLILMPLALLAGLIVWAGLYLSTRVVAVASVGFGISLPVSSALLYRSDDPRMTLGLILGLIIVIRHRSNLSRLLQGKENKFK